MKRYQITEWCANFIRAKVRPGDLCIDATMGNGNDTLLLCRLCGETGRVLAFDIQEAALAHTRERLLQAGAPKNYELFLSSHTHLKDHASACSASCIIFNLGYLPGGDHSLSTTSATSITAMEQALSILKKDGLLSICIYSGRDSGFAERDAVLSWLRSLDPSKYLVIRCDYYNRPNNPPIPVLVYKLKE